MTVRPTSTFFSRKLRITVVIFINILIIIWSLAGGYAYLVEERKTDSINYISFSPDGKKIIFNRNKGELPNFIHTYNLETGELVAYQSPSEEYWSMARYSLDGRKIVFVTVPRGKKNIEHHKAELALIDTDGKNIRRITDTSGYKAYPSFSHSGDKVIFLQDEDIYEVEINNPFKEDRLTWFKFLMSAPYYLPDDQTIIFSAYGTPRIFPGISDNDYDAIKRKQEELDKRSQQALGRGDNIYIVKKGQKELPEPLILSKDGLRQPLISASGIIFFETKAYKPDGKPEWANEYFQYSPDGHHRRITFIHEGSIHSSSISPDGKWLAIVLDEKIGKIVIYKVDDGTSRKIDLPDKPSRIINKQ